MAEPVVARPVRVGTTETGEVRVPRDVANLLGDDAELRVGPGQVVTPRPAELRASALATAVEPLDDPARLRHTTAPLTPDERAALADFLAE